MDHIDEYRAKKEGKVTPEMLLKILQHEVETGNIDSIAYVAKRKDGMITSGWTDMLHTEAIGLYEIAKLQVVDDLYDDENES